MPSNMVIFISPSTSIYDRGKPVLLCPLDTGHYRKVKSRFPPFISNRWHPLQWEVIIWSSATIRHIFLKATVSF